MPLGVRRNRLFFGSGMAGLAVVALVAGWGGRERPPEPRPAPAATEAAAPERPPPPEPLTNPTLLIGLRATHGAERVTLTPASSGTLLDAETGEQLALLAAGQPVSFVREPETGRVRLEGTQREIAARRLRVEGAEGRLRLGGRSYYGALLLYPVEEGLQVANEVELETYLEGVLPGELPASFAPEAQRALAVAARTYALRNLEKHAEHGYDICDGPHCQVYLGYDIRSPRAWEAVRATRGLCAWYGDELAYTFYSAHCGGQSTYGHEVPLPDMPAEIPPYLRPVRDAPAGGGADYCHGSPHRSWSFRLSRAELEARLNEEPETEIGRLLSARVDERDETGRIRTVRLEGERPETGERVTKTVSGWDFRRQAGPMRMRATQATIERAANGDYVISGAGFGHGLGLCQIGANGMARAPHQIGFREILTHYYPGIEIAAEAPAAR